MKYLILLLLLPFSVVKGQPGFVSYGRQSDLTSYTDVPSQSSLPCVIKGDFNEDGVDDIAMIGRPNGGSTDRVTIFSGHCENYIEQTLSSFNCTFLAEADNLLAADFNNDNHLDIVVGGKGPITFFRGDGNGNFTFEDTLSIQSATFTSTYYEIAYADFDHDTFLDVAVNVTDNSHWMNQTYLLHGTGNFNFNSPLPLDNFFNGSHLNALDINSDGFADLVGSANILLLNNSGTFNIPVFNSSTMYVQNMKEVFYMNADADPYIEYYTINDTILFFGELNYNLATQPLIYRIPATKALSFTIGDFDYDGIKNDFAFSYDTSAVNIGFSHLNVFNNVKLSSGGRGKIFSVDLDGIGSSLLFCSRFYLGMGEYLRFYRNASYFRFTNGESFPSGAYVTGVAVADFDQDGFDDIAAICKNSINVNLYYGGPCTFKRYSRFNIGVAQCVSIGTGKFNNDTFPDLVLGNVLNDSLYVYLNDGSGNFPVKQSYPGGHGIYELQVGDMNHDGFDDVISLSHSPSFVGVHLANTTGGLGQPDISTGTDGSITVRGDGLIVKDYNDDGNLDVCNAHGAAASYGFSVLYGDGTGALPQNTRSTFPGGHDIFVYPTNLNNDGYIDIVHQNFLNNNFFAMCSDTARNWNDPTCISNTISVSANDIAGCDFNNDSLEDFVLTYDGVTNTIAKLILRNSANAFVEETLNVGTASVTPQTGDINGDGKPDIIVGNQLSDDISVLINDLPGFPVSVNEQLSETNFLLFPNPASEKITIKRMNTKSAELIIYNSIGVYIGKMKLNGLNSDITVSNLENGFYFCTIIENSDRTTKCFVVVH